MVFTSSKGHPLDLSKACDCRTKSLSSLSLISPKGEALQRNMTIRRVTTEVNSPIISQTGTMGLSAICSKAMGLQFFTINEPVKKKFYQATTAANRKHWQMRRKVKYGRV